MKSPKMTAKVHVMTKRHTYMLHEEAQGQF